MRFHTLTAATPSSLKGCAEWRDVDSGELVETERGALVFVIRDGKVARLAVHRDLTAALSDGGLSEADTLDPRAP